VSHISFWVFRRELHGTQYPVWKKHTLRERKEVENG
jgi:hypothetical protein